MLKRKFLFLRLKNFYRKGLAMLIGSIVYKSAFASDTGPAMPWDGPLTTVEKALSGTTAHMAILIAIVLGGIGFAIGEHGGILRKCMGVIIGGSIAVGATSLYSTLQMGGALV
jgi:type IV secretion system protein VirB2